MALDRLPCFPSYSPECVEGLFCELRLYGVLGSSPEEPSCLRLLPPQLMVSRKPGYSISPPHYDARRTVCRVPRGHLLQAESSGRGPTSQLPARPERAGWPLLP